MCAVTFTEFKDEASKILNINLDGYKIKRVQRRTDSLMNRYNISDYEQCLKLLKSDSNFKTAYLNHFTINTSEFFRNPENFTYLKEKILPKLFTENNNIKIWSSPCSNGSEPYTIAIIITELGYNAKNYQILASDIDENILKSAQEGIYGPNSLQNIPVEILAKYFSKLPGNKYKLKKRIMNQVSFEKKDLINDPYSNSWDIILCRNFFIYLTKDIKNKLIHKYTKVLKPGGFFFLGNTEFIFNPEKYGLKKVYSSFYQKMF